MEALFFRYNPWWENKFKTDHLFEREEILESLMHYFDSKQIQIITGLRRIGKTSILMLLIKRLIDRNIEPRQIFYISLDDYLMKDLSILEIIDNYRIIMKLDMSEKIFLFLDEITYKTDFEIQLKNLYDQQNVKIFISSSNAMAIEDKKAFLTGRTFVFEILPLTYKEYLKFKKIKIDMASEHLHEAYFDDFLKSGGIPEYVLTGDFLYIKNLVDDIIFKDIAAVHGVKDLSLLKDFFLLLMERSGKQMSVNKIANILCVSPDTARRFLDFFARTFLIHLVKRHGKTNERLLSASKIYAADLGIRNLFTTYRDKGSAFENYVFLRIKHLKPSYIYQDSNEIDFFTEGKILIEAKYHNEPLSGKQQILYDNIEAKEKYIVRNEEDIEQMLSNVC